MKRASWATVLLAMAALATGAVVVWLLVRPIGPVRPTPADQPRADAHAQAESVVARVRVVDLEGRPLAHMAPIATRRPNAFDEPVARGELTGPDGSGTVVLPPGQRLCVRAWDPTLKLFSNNYYDVMPDSGTQTELMTLAMAPGASLRAALVAANGDPAANMRVRLMMSHPTEGPWWPDRADTDQTGAVEFPSLPAGTYTIRIETQDAGQLEIPEVDLPPGGHTDLGTLALQ